MIELQAQDDTLFEQLLPYAVYASPRTKVLAIPEEKRDLIPKNYPINIENKETSLCYKKHNFYINGVDEIVKLYLGMYNLAGSSFSFRSLSKLNDLIESGIITVNKSFRETFPKLKKGATVKELLCSDCGFRVNKKLNKYTDILDMPVNEMFDNCRVAVKEYRVRPFKIYDSYTEKDRSKRDRLVIAGSYKDVDGLHDLSAHMYGAVTGFKKIFKRGVKVNVILDSNNKFVSFAPNGFDKKEEEIVSPNGEVRKKLNGLPVMLYRIAYEEVRLRKLIN